MAAPRTIDEYLAGLSGDQRAALQKVRKEILAAAPKAEECFSYGLPAFRDESGLIAGFGASAKHCAYYPMSGSVVGGLERDLKGYRTSKGAIRFEASKPLPATLVRKLVKARQAENGAKPAPAKKAKAKPGTTRRETQTDPAVTAYLRKLDHPLKKEFEVVRGIILGASPEISEGIKWNVPSFRTSNDFFATMNVRTKDSVQLVFHLGAKVRKDLKTPKIVDPKRLVKWLAKDRAMITLGMAKDISAHRAAFEAIVRAWIKFV